MMAQNAYDKDFGLCNSYNKGRNEKILKQDSYLVSLIPLDFNGLNVIDFGCGNGWFCRGVIEMGALKVFGVDISNNMISKAKSLEKENSKIEYQVQDLNNISINEMNIGTFDYAFSSFTIHYLPNLESFFKSVYTLLKPGGMFLFCTEHPIRTSSICTTDYDFIDHTFTGEERVRKVWPVSDYSDDGGIRIRNFFGFNGIIKYHHSFASYINSLIKVGFKIEFIGEPLMSDRQLECFSKSGDMSIERNVPISLYIKVSKCK